MSPETDELLTKAALEYIAAFGPDAAERALDMIRTAEERGDTPAQISFAKMILGRLLELQPADTKHN